MKIKVEIFDEVKKRLVEAEIQEIAKPNNFFIVKLKVDGQTNPSGQLLFALFKDHLYIANLTNFNRNYSGVGTVLTRYAFTQSLNFNKQGRITLEAVNNSSLFWEKMGFEFRDNSKSNMYLSENTIKNKLVTNFAIEAALTDRTSELKVPNVSAGLVELPRQLKQDSSSSPSGVPITSLYQPQTFFGSESRYEKNLVSPEVKLDEIKKASEEEADKPCMSPEQLGAGVEEVAANNDNISNCEENAGGSNEGEEADKKLAEAQKEAESAGFTWRSF
ncbi:hypothetical protein ACNVED_11710 [Legionella sp. D16C41]|uniref:hypothetical protein n=1 Tax=Legionella sp. D16C41 TaxID=3402688 RepID=UPI003AF4D089